MFCTIFADDIPIATDEETDLAPKKASRKTSDVRMLEARRHSDLSTTEVKGSKGTEVKKRDSDRKKSKRVVMSTDRKGKK